MTDSSSEAKLFYINCECEIFVGELRGVSGFKARVRSPEGVVRLCSSGVGFADVLRTVCPFGSQSTFTVQLDSA